MEKLPKIFIIILNYDGKDTIKACLESVYRSDYVNYEVVVVDNASRDESFELAKKFFSRAHFILNEKNIGFAAGNNAGIRFALEKFADYIFLLNNDAVVGEDMISKLVIEAQNCEKGGIFSPVILDKNNKVWFAGGRIKWLKMKAIHDFSVRTNRTHKTDYVSGCAMLVKKEVFREIGLFDEKYFLYYEDADFCLRARKGGFQCLVVPGAKITHYEKSKSNLENKTYWLVLSGLIFFKKHAPLILRPWMNFYLFLRKVKNWTDAKFKKDNISLAVQRAYKDYKNIKL